MENPDFISRYRDTLNEVIKESEIFLEKWIISICSGVLAISTAIIPFCVEKNEMSNEYLIIISWLSILIGLVVCLVSHHITKYSAQNIVKHLDNMNNEGDIDCINYKIIRRNKIIDSLNIFCIFLIVLSLVFLGTFVYINFII